jgi:cystathionine gamma-synthase
VRQLSIKARRNCSNIGVAQVVAASATDRPSLDAAISTLPQSADVLKAQQQLGSSAHATDGGAAATSTFVIDSTLLSQAIAATTTSSCNNGSLPVEKSKPMTRGTLAVHGGAFSLFFSLSLSYRSQIFAVLVVFARKTPEK